MNNPKRIPYGMMNFVALREENCYYVDKTRFVEEIEHANMYFFYIRPRRFGKSLTLSMLRHYYDVNEADKFETWFKGLYIGEHPTPLHNSYLVLYFNFSVVNGEIVPIESLWIRIAIRSLLLFVRSIHGFCRKMP